MENIRGLPDAYDQLRRANNSFKHSDAYVDSDIRNIPEFTGKEYLSCLELEKFYNRIKGSPYVLLNNLTSAIYIDLFHFDQEKIGGIANELAMRMNKDVAHKFVDHFLSLYKNDNPPEFDLGYDEEEE